jgi:PKD repeat protein
MVATIMGAISILSAPTSAQQLPKVETPGGTCGTQEIYDAKPANHARRALGLCDIGPCDAAATRDGWIPTPSTTLTFFKLYFNVFREDDGANAACTAADVDSQLAQINADYLPYRIQFEKAGMRFVNSTAYRYITANAEFDAMKAAFAVQPDSQCNVYVVSVNIGGDVFSFATFPWDSDALTVYGGIVMNRTQFFPFNDHTLTHEMGHCLGLWHTHHGVSEVSQCGVCYESATQASNLTGDLCADTDPTPTNFNCSGPGGSDPCNGFSWGATDPNNYMGYGPNSCVNMFSSQQSGRMLCWASAELQGWMSGVRFVADTTFGPAPLAVSFEGQSAQNVTSWDWDFGDGNHSSLQNTTHEFGPGNFDVSLAIQSGGGPYVTTKKGFVWAYADTFQVANALGRNNRTVRVDISAHNYLPLTRILVPFTWAGPYNVVMDSVRNAGTRTAGWILTQVQQDLANKRLTYEINFATPGGPGIFLPAGNGPVMSLYFRIPSTMPQGASHPISVLSYGLQVPTFEVQPGYYYGGTIAGGITVCLAGDVSNDGNGPDIEDLSYLIAYLYLDGPPIPVSAKADIDGTPGIDIGDISAMISYMYLGGPLNHCNL